MTTHDATSRYDAGLTVRRAVLGDDYVNRSLERVTDFTSDFQQLVTEYCWGAVWTREGLDRQTRSLINLAMLTALNRPHEIELHTSGALRNGCTAEQIREVLLQTMIYCGVPAAVDSFRIASKVLQEHIDGA